MIQFSNEIVSNLNDLPLLRFYHSVLSPFKRNYVEHRHTAFEISMVISGRGLYKLDGRVYEFSPGDVFLFSTNEIHCITEITGTDPLDLMNLQYEPRFIWSPGNELFDYRYLSIYFNRSPSFRHQLLHDDPRGREIRSLLGEIKKEFQQKAEGYELMVKIKLLAILVNIRRNYHGYFEVAPLAMKGQQLAQLDGAMRYIDDHLSQDLNLNDLAAQAHMSRSYFSTVFRQLNGVSPWEYIVNKRISLAAHSLMTCNLTILETATACGFNNAANFNHAFRKIVGKSPSEYRRELRGKQG